METKNNALDFVMELEQKSMELYSDLARRATLKELSGIFQFLASQEKSHYEIVKSWQDNTVSPALEETPFFPDIDKVFKNLSDHFNGNGTMALHYYNAYEKARTFEEKSVAFYEQLLENSEAGRKSILMKIIDQEKNHVLFIVNLLEFLRHPGEWLENAEWYHQEEY